jgi:hypothetical protein
MARLMLRVLFIVAILCYSAIYVMQLRHCHAEMDLLVLVGWFPKSLLDRLSQYRFRTGLLGLGLTSQFWSRQHQAGYYNE